MPQEKWTTTPPSFSGSNSTTQNKIGFGGTGDDLASDFWPHNFTEEVDPEDYQDTSINLTSPNPTEIPTSMEREIADLRVEIEKLKSYLTSLSPFHNNLETDDHLPSPIINDNWLEKWQAESPEVFMTDDEVDAQILEYEQKFNMSSEELLRCIKEGSAPDEDGIIDWKLLLKYR